MDELLALLPQAVSPAISKVAVPVSARTLRGVVLIAVSPLKLSIGWALRCEDGDCCPAGVGVVAVWHSCCCREEVGESGRNRRPGAGMPYLGPGLGGPARRCRRPVETSTGHRYES